MSEAAAEVAEAIAVDEKEDVRLNTQTYDSSKLPEFNINWPSLTHNLGTLPVMSHRLCTMLEVTSLFTKASYTNRLARRDGYYGPNGTIIKMPKVTKSELMAMDMDAFMSIINVRPNRGYQPNHIIIHTNDTEDKEWIDFLERCPYAWKVYVLPSKMAKYNVTGWILSLTDPRPKNAVR